MKIYKILSVGVLLSAIESQVLCPSMSSVQIQTLMNIVDVVQALKQHGPFAPTSVPANSLPSSSVGVNVYPVSTPFLGNFSVTQSTNLNVVTPANVAQYQSIVPRAADNIGGSITSLNYISIGLTDANQNQYAGVLFTQQVFNNPNIVNLIQPGAAGIYIQISLQIINGVNVIVVELTDTTPAENVLATGYIPVSGQPTTANIGFNIEDTLLAPGKNQMVYNGFKFAGNKLLYQTPVAPQPVISKLVSTTGVQVYGSTSFAGTFTPSYPANAPVVSINNLNQYQQYAQKVTHSNQFVSGSVSKLQFINVGLTDQNMNNYATVVFPTPILQQANILPLIAPGGAGICLQVTLQTISGVNYAIVELTDTTPQANVLATGVIPNIQGNLTIANIGFNMSNTHNSVGTNQMFANGFLFQKARLLYQYSNGTSTNSQTITQAVPQTTSNVSVLQGQGTVFAGTFTPTITKNLIVNNVKNVLRVGSIQSLNLISIGLTDSSENSFIGAIFPQSVLQQSNIAPLIAPGGAGIYIQISLQVINGGNYAVIQLTDTTPQANVLATAVVSNVTGNPTIANIGFNMTDSRAVPSVNQMALNSYVYAGTQLLYQIPSASSQSSSAATVTNPNTLTTSSNVQILTNATPFVGNFVSTLTQNLTALNMNTVSGNLRQLKNGMMGVVGSITSLNSISVGLTDRNQNNYVGAIFPQSVLQQSNIAPLIAPGAAGIYIQISLQVINGVNSAIIALTDTTPQENVLALGIVPNIVGRPGIANIGFNMADSQATPSANQMALNGYLYIGNKLLYQTPQ